MQWACNLKRVTSDLTNCGKVVRGACKASLDMQSIRLVEDEQYGTRL